jgi:hypothetical protein
VLLFVARINFECQTLMGSAWMFSPCSIESLYTENDSRDIRIIMKATLMKWPEAPPLPDGMQEGSQDLTPEQIVLLFESGFDMLLRHQTDGTEPRVYLSPAGRGFNPRG